MRVVLAVLAITLLAGPAPAWQATVSTDPFFFEPDVAVNGSGDVAMVFTEGTTGGRVAKYSAQGIETWRVNTATGSHIAFGDGDDVIAGGGSDFTWTVYRLDGATGSLEWQVAVTGRAMAALGVDGAGDVVAAGSVEHGTFGNPRSTFLVVKLDGVTGAELWRYELNGTAASQNIDAATAMVIDAGGDVLVAGNLFNPAPTGRDAVVVRLDGTTGAEIWRTSLDGVNNSVDEASAIALDPNGDVLVAGELGTLVDGGGAIAKLDGATGVEVWRTIDSTAQQMLYLASDSSGAAVGLGRYFEFLLPDRPCLLIKLDDATGTEVWREQLEVSECDPYAVAIDSNDDVLSVVFESGFPLETTVISKHGSEDGARLWNWLGPGQSVRHVAVRSDDQVLFTGVSLGPVDFKLLLSQVGTMLAARKLKVLDPLPEKRVLAFKAERDTTGVIAAAGEPGDPTIGGGALVLRNPGTAETASFVLPASGWKGLGVPAGTTGYLYSDGEHANGPCSKIKLQVKNHRVTFLAKCKGPIGFSLDEASQGSLEVRLTAGTGARALTYCSRFGGTILQDDPGAFFAKSALPPPSCP